MPTEISWHNSEQPKVNVLLLLYASFNVAGL